MEDVSLKNAPDGWMEATLGYRRNPKYYGFNRSYTDPLKFVKDAAYILRTKFYLETGIQTKITLLILKYNQNPQPGEPTYKLYHKAPIDFPQKIDKIAEGFQCNLLEGGVLQMLKTYENTVFSIPCDGSIPENIKVNMDGMFLEDTFNYQFVNHQILDIDSHTCPAVFLSNDGDNIGIIHQDTQYDTFTILFPQQLALTSNFLMSTIRPIQIRVQGNITVNKNTVNTEYLLEIGTTSGNGAVLVGTDTGLSVPVNGPQTFYFDKTFTVLSNEKVSLFEFCFQHNCTIVGGNFTLSFASIAADTAPWCVTGYDLFKLLIKNICQAASTQFQTFNFGADSQLLQECLNLVCTSGDAIRASGDPNYQKFYNAIQANPNFPNVNNTYSFGPVIKTSLSDFFQSFNAIKSASLGNQTLDR